MSLWAAVRGVGRAERERLAREALSLVKLAGMETRRPAQLSGGQRQRVALARALVVRPKVLLLDEPLGALDLKLREEMQSELKGLQRALGLTFVFVTHDQSEALSMADRVAVFNEGRIVQVGPPEEVYEQPATRFVARFVGSANVLEPAEAQALGGPARPCSLRPEKILLLAPGVPVPEARRWWTRASPTFPIRARCAASAPARRRARPHRRCSRHRGGGDGGRRYPLRRARRGGAADGGRGMSLSLDLPAPREGCCACVGCAGAAGRLLTLLLADAAAAVAGPRLSRQPVRLPRQSIFSIDEFSGTIVREPTIATLLELFRPPITTSCCATSALPPR